VIIILGFFAFFQWEFSLSVLAAVLAVLGYSVNESVVVFDRVRETFKKVRGLTTPQVLDHAITSTISRTIITHGSTQMMVLSMLHLRWRDAVLLLAGADHRHLLRHLLLGAGRQPAGDVARCLARAVHQAEEADRRRQRGRRAVVFGSTYARFLSFLPTPNAILAYLRGQWRGLGHNPLGALSVFGLLGLLAFQVSSGLFANDDIAFRGPLYALVSSEFSERLTGWHKLSVNLLDAAGSAAPGGIGFYAHAKKDNWSGRC
jgi:hypothetical protein